MSTHNIDSPEFAARGCAGWRRRRVIRIAVAGAAIGCTPLQVLAQAANTNRPRAGDLLCGDEMEKDPVAVNAKDVLPGKPMLVYPFDPTTRQIRNDSRLNKIVLVRLADAELDADTRVRAAGAVVAYSAVCTHQNCDVKTWIAADRSLVCFCHSSKFLPAESGRVSAGEHQAVWDGRDDAGQALPTGTYFYRLSIDGRPAGRAEKAVLVR